MIVLGWAATVIGLVTAIALAMTINGLVSLLLVVLFVASFSVASWAFSGRRVRSRS